MKFDININNIIGFSLTTITLLTILNKLNKNLKYKTKNIINKELLIPKTIKENNDNIIFSGNNNSFAGFYYTTVFVFDENFDIDRFKKSFLILLETYPVLGCHFEKYKDNNGINKIKLSKKIYGVEYNEKLYIGYDKNLNIKEKLFSKDRLYFQNNVSCDFDGLYPNDKRVMSITITKGFNNSYKTVSFYISHALFDMASFSLILNELSKISLNLKKLEKSNVNYNLNMTENELVEYSKKNKIVEKINKKVDMTSKITCLKQLYKVILTTLNIYYSKKYNCIVDSKILTDIKNKYNNETNNWASSYEVFVACILSCLVKKNEDDFELFIVINYRGRCNLIPSNYIGNANGSSWLYPDNNKKIKIKIYKNNLNKTIENVHNHLRSAIEQSEKNLDIFYYYETLKFQNLIDKVWQFNAFKLYTEKGLLFNSWVNFKDKIVGWSINNNKPLLLSPLDIPMPHLVQTVPFTHKTNDFIFSLTLRTIDTFDQSHLPNGLFKNYL